jgi:integrase/recombinase XerC
MRCMPRNWRRAPSRAPSRPGAATTPGWRGAARSSNPADGLRAPKRPRSLPKALGIDQAAALLDRAGAGARVRRCPCCCAIAMFELFYSSGLRLSELVSLDWPGGLDLAAGEVTVTGKRRKTRTVPVGDKARAALQAWLALRPQLLRGEQPALFLGRNGTRLTPRQVESRLAQWAQRQGVGVHVHPHMLRHSFASHVLQSSGDLRAVQEMLGHASIAATQIYTHLDFQHLAKIYDAAHPRAKTRPGLHRSLRPARRDTTRRRPARRSPRRASGARSGAGWPSSRW